MLVGGEFADRAWHTSACCAAASFAGIWRHYGGPIWVWVYPAVPRVLGGSCLPRSIIKEWRVIELSALPLPDRASIPDVRGGLTDPRAKRSAGIVLPPR